MNIHFSKVIKAGDRNREFNFTRTNPSSNQFSVNVPDERGNRIFFTMVNEGNSWKASMDILPQWILNAEDALSRAIEEEIQVGENKPG